MKNTRYSFFCQRFCKTTTRYFRIQDLKKKIILHTITPPNFDPLWTCMSSHCPTNNPTTTGAATTPTSTSPNDLQTPLPPRQRHNFVTVNLANLLVISLINWRSHWPTDKFHQLNNDCLTNWSAISLADRCSHRLTTSPTNWKTPPLPHNRLHNRFTDNSRQPINYLTKAHYYVHIYIR